MGCLLRCFGSGTDLLSNELFCCNSAAKHLNKHLLQLVIGLVQVMSGRTKVTYTKQNTWLFSETKSLNTTQCKLVAQKVPSCHFKVLAMWKTELRNPQVSKEN